MDIHRQRRFTALQEIEHLHLASTVSKDMGSTQSLHLSHTMSSSKWRDLRIDNMALNDVSSYASSLFTLFSTSQMSTVTQKFYLSVCHDKCYLTVKSFENIEQARTAYYKLNENKPKEIVECTASSDGTADFWSLMKYGDDRALKEVEMNLIKNKESIIASLVKGARDMNITYQKQDLSDYENKGFHTNMIGKERIDDTHGYWKSVTNFFKS
ncbi:hypothetical protein BDB01DRAFT_838814 [Pilobolus umbonatus]|nr:hypothetical protein BDB01DRAFT_838814 [Pilobolus umbonatus]